MKFEHGVSDFMIGGVKISADKICLNYDRKGNILIGMDILKDWDIHIGVSKETGKSLFLWGSGTLFAKRNEGQNDNLKIVICLFLFVP